MEIRNLSDHATETFLNGLIASGRNVPFIGTGFTRGERAKARVVPDGKEWMNIMRQQISESSVTLKPSADQLTKYDFQQLSDIYFRDEIVDISKIKNTLDQYFSDVNIVTQSKLSFLSLPWPYLYTLNIDDGIERAIGGVKVVPYEPFAKSSTRRYVYKMHGDVFTALKAVSRDDLKLIFSKGDYIRSLNRNRPLIDALKVDLAESNILFIGCSLTDEIDILYALSDHELSSPSVESRRVYVTSSSPDGDYDTMKKLRDYKITDVIVGDYDAFYLKCTELTRQVLVDESPANIFEFHRVAPEMFTPEKFLQYFLQINWKGGDSSYLSVPRSLEKTLLERLSSKPLTILTGPRFSGRTSAAYRALRSFTSKKSYFLNSETVITDGMLAHILSLKNSFIVFDSESLNFSQIRTVCQSRDKVELANSSILLALDKNDLFAAENAGEQSTITLSSRFTSEERAAINNVLDSVGTNRLATSGTILDNIYQVAGSAVVTKSLGGETSLQRKIDDRVKYASKTLTRSEFGLLYILAAKQKVLSIIYRSILEKDGFTTTADDYISTLEKLWTPFIEKTSTDRSTMEASHSSYSLISNSQAWIFYALRSFASALGVNKSASLIVETVAAIKTHPDHYELIMFDVLNAIFASSLTGSSHTRVLIGETYKELSKILSSDPNYWLQRAKSIYHDHLANDTISVLAAIEHANKAITETEKTVTVNAKLTRANLHGLLCQVDKYQNPDYFVSAVNYYYEIIEDYHLNKEYLDQLIKKNKAGRGYLRAMLNNIPGAGIEILKLRDKVAHLRHIVGLDS